MGSPKRIVICGGGAIGAAIAYFMSMRGARPIVIERYEVGGAASGTSGGFLALDWCQDSPLDRLARRSFALHARLSADLGDPWGYRRLRTYSGYAAADDYRARYRRATVAVRWGYDHGSARLSRVYGGGRAPRVHERFDAGRSGAWRGAAE
jgi:glycine/D-amino acid oxidase-like deaminating enzyme